MTYNDEDRGRCRRPDTEDRRWLHRSGTRWLDNREFGWRCVRSAPCTWKRAAHVSWPKNHWTILSGLTSKPVMMISPDLTSKSVLDFLVEPQNQGGGGFSSLDLKISNYNLMILTLKSPRCFLGLCLKIKRASIYRLRHNPMEGGRRETRVEI
jgi:hypothetical protein